MDICGFGHGAELIFLRQPSFRWFWVPFLNYSIKKQFFPEIIYHMLDLYIKAMTVDEGSIIYLYGKAIVVQHVILHLLSFVLTCLLDLVH